MTIGVILDTVLLVLLASTCLYCMRLNKKLAAVKEGQTALRDSIAAFDVAARRAENTLRQAESVGDLRHDNFEATMRRATAMAAELSVMINAGDNIAGRLENAVGDVKRISARQGGFSASRERKRA